jgi:hypothetical protein
VSKSGRVAGSDRVAAVSPVFPASTFVKRRVAAIPVGSNMIIGSFMASSQLAKGTELDLCNLNQS